MARTWPLTGRSEELRFIDTAVGRTDGPRGVVLAGAAGVGKTRVAREAVAAAGERGATVRWVSATASARATPLGAFSSVLGGVRGDPGLVVRHAAEQLLAAANGSPIVVGVDDAHLLDDVSAMVVHQLASGKAVTVVATVRSGEPAPDAVTALWKDGHLDRLEVQPLSEPETGVLLEGVLRGQVDSRTVNQLWTMTRGNALYLRQLVDGALEGDGFHAEGGVWRLSRPPELSHGLAEMVATRMGRLTGAVLDVVDILALGEPLGVSVLGELTDPVAVERAENQAVVEIERDGRRLEARLAHPLYGETRRAELGQLRARRLRGRIAMALASSGSRRADDALRRALLTLDSDLEPDVSLWIQAGERAVQLMDFELAGRLGRAAVAAGGGFRAQRMVAFSIMWTESQATIEAELAALADMAGTDAELVRVSLFQATTLAWLDARPEQAEAVLDAATERVRDPDARVPLSALRAMLDGQRGRPQQAAEAATAILAVADRSDESVLMASCGLAAALAVSGRADDINAVASRGLAAATSSAELALFRIPLMTVQVMGLLWAGVVDEAGALAREYREQIKDMDMGGPTGCHLMGEAAFVAGRLGEARRWLREARAGIEPFGHAGGWHRGYAILIGLTKTLAISGELVAARESLSDLYAHRHATMVFLEPELVLARAWVAAAEGAVSEAIALAHEAAGVAELRGQLAHVVLALQTATRFGDRTVAERLAGLADQVQGPRAPAAAAHAAALTADDGAALQAASTHLEEMGDPLSAADAAAQAADAFARQGRKGSATTLAARAHHLAEQCGGACTPALARSARPLPLTAREREVVTLAARGLTNREIADRLVVSIRTVEGHLYRAAAKLGTSDRKAFAALLGNNT